jgi:hypothetical protein
MKSLKRGQLKTQAYLPRTPLFKKFWISVPFASLHNFALPRVMILAQVHVPKRNPCLPSHFIAPPLLWLIKYIRYHILIW